MQNMNMDDKLALGIAVVRVVTDQLVEGKPVTQLWAAAVARTDAVEAVMRNLPASWTGELTDQRLTQGHVRRLKMGPGAVRELSSAE